VLLYLESFGNGRKFARIARRVARRKPIVAVKAGRSVAGARAAGSHTGAMLSAADVSVDALFAQSGVIRAESLGELFDIAQLLADQPLPTDPAVAILTNAGGPGILAADACEPHGLPLAELAPATAAALQDVLPQEASVANPVDTVAGATPDDLAQCARLLLADPGVGALLVALVPTPSLDTEDAARALRDVVASRARDVPVVVSVLGGEGRPAGLREGATRVPCYANPEDAVRALARVATYAQWRALDDEERPVFDDTRPDEAASVVAEALRAEPVWLSPLEVWRLLDCYGIPQLGTQVVHSAAGVVKAAQELGGGPVAVKAIADRLVHKSDIGAVKLGLDSAASQRRAAGELREATQAAGLTLDGMLVQQMAPPGLEMLVGVVQDPSFGPVVACGAGGTMLELLGDVGVAVSPVTRRQAHDLVRSLRTFPLLDGYRGSPRLDVAALEDVLLRVGELVEGHPEIAELDLNPVVVGEHGAVVADARIRVAQPRGTWLSTISPAD